MARIATAAEVEDPAGCLVHEMPTGGLPGDRGDPVEPPGRIHGVEEAEGATCQVREEERVTPDDLSNRARGATTTTARTGKRRVSRRERQQQLHSRHQVSVSEWAAARMTEVSGPAAAGFPSPQEEEEAAPHIPSLKELSRKVDTSCAQEVARMGWRRESVLSSSPRVGVGVGSGAGANGEAESSAKVAPEETAMLPARASVLSGMVPEERGAAWRRMSPEEREAAMEGLVPEELEAIMSAMTPAERRYEAGLNPLQEVFMPIIHSDAFYYSIMAAIAINCIQLAVTSPLETDPQLMKDINEILDHTLFAVFSIEFVCKHCALLVDGYWSDNWNRLDGTIVVVGYLAFVPGVGDYPAIRVLPPYLLHELRIPYMNSLSLTLTPYLLQGASYHSSSAGDRKARRDEEDSGDDRLGLQRPLRHVASLLPHLFHVRHHWLHALRRGDPPSLFWLVQRHRDAYVEPHCR